MAAHHITQAWALLQDNSFEIERSSKNDHRRFQQAMLRLFKRSAVLRVAQRWQACQQQRWRPFRQVSFI